MGGFFCKLTPEAFAVVFVSFVNDAPAEETRIRPTDFDLSPILLPLSSSVSKERVVVVSDVVELRLSVSVSLVASLPFFFFLRTIFIILRGRPVLITLKAFTM